MNWLRILLQWFSRPNTPSNGPEPPQGDVAAQVVEEINRIRGRHGLPLLKYHSCLANQAQHHAEKMAATSRLSHDGFAGRLQHCQTGAGSENVAAGQNTAQECVESWMGSYGHRANILKRSHASIGVGYSTGGSYGSWWCALFSG